MFENTFSDLGKAIVISEGIQADGMAVLEPNKLEVFEKKYISGVDEMRVNEIADVMTEVFSEDVITSWSEMSLDEKSSIISEYYVKAGDALGINTEGVIVEPMYDEPGVISYGYNSGDGYIHLNEAIVDDPSLLGQVLDTTTHEMRHQFQNDVLLNPANFSDISESTMQEWQYELTPGNYIDPDYDYEGYYNQAIECDARSFSESVIDSYLNKMNLN